MGQEIRLLLEEACSALETAVRNMEAAQTVVHAQGRRLNRITIDHALEQLSLAHKTIARLAENGRGQD